MNVRGKEFHGEVSSADANLGVAFKLYLGGMVTEYTLKTNEKVCITDIDLVVTAAGTAGIFNITNAAGKRIVRGAFDANSGISKHLETPHICPAGVVPVVIADAACGQIEVIIHGFLVR